MLLVDHYRALARYNGSMNERLYDVCAALSDEERRRDRGAFFRSIHGTLNHILLADRAWLGRFSDDVTIARSVDAAGNTIAIRGLDHELYADFSELRRERAKTDAAIEAWVERLTADALAAPIRYRTTAGEPCEHPLWKGALHFFNHQTHHRGQLTTLLSQLGKDPGVTDLIALLRTDGGS